MPCMHHREGFRHREDRSAICHLMLVGSSLHGRFFATKRIMGTSPNCSALSANYLLVLKIQLYLISDLVSNKVSLNLHNLRLHFMHFSRSMRLKKARLLRAKCESRSMWILLNP